MTGAWLFVRGEESIWLQRSSAKGFELDMHGPLSLRRHYSFATATELDAFLADVEGRLTPAGWALQRFEPGKDRRSSARSGATAGSERRGWTTHPRGTSDDGGTDGPAEREGVGKRVELSTDDGPLDVYIHLPRERTGGSWPAVVVYMDAFGIRSELGEMAQRLADGGYVVALPNLYHRTPFAPFDPVAVAAGGAERDRFRSMIASVDGPKIMGDTAAVLAYLSASSDVRAGAVAAVGYCMGGGYALLAAGTFPEAVSMAASFHGGSLATDRPDSPHLLAPMMRATLYVGAGELDPTFPTEQRARLEGALTTAGVPYRVEVYPGAKHGFAVTGHLAYDRESSERHWDRLFELLSTHL